MLTVSFNDPQTSDSEKPSMEMIVGRVSAVQLTSSPSVTQTSATYSRVLSIIKEEGGLMASKPMTGNSTFIILYIVKKKEKIIY